MLAGYCFVVVVHDEAKVLLSFGLTVSKIFLESRNNLFESLFAYRALGHSRIEMDFVYALGKQACKAPVPKGLCNFLDETLTFGVRKVYVRIGMFVILPGLFVCSLFLLPLKLQKMSVTMLNYLPSSLVPAQSLKSWDSGLFQIASEEPCRVQFFSSKPVFAQDSRYFTISVIPPPNWDRNSGKYEMRRASRDIRCSGFVDVAEIHFIKSLISEGIGD